MEECEGVGRAEARLAAAGAGSEGTSDLGEQWRLEVRLSHRTTFLKADGPHEEIRRRRRGSAGRPQSALPGAAGRTLRGASQARRALQEVTFYNIFSKYKLTSIYITETLESIKLLEHGLNLQARARPFHVALKTFSDPPSAVILRGMTSGSVPPPARRLSPRLRLSPGHSGPPCTSFFVNLVPLCPRSDSPFKV